MTLLTEYLKAQINIMEMNEEDSAKSKDYLIADAYKIRGQIFERLLQDIEEGQFNEN